MPLPSNQDEVRMTHVLARLQDRALRRLYRYGESNLDWDERLTGEAEDLEAKVGRMLIPLLEKLYERT